jgi:hypothetical protein
MSSSFDVEGQDEVTERNELCPEGVKEPNVITDKNCVGELYEKWIEMRGLYKCLTLLLVISLIIILSLNIADENFFRDPGPEQLTARIMRGGGSHKKTCSDNEYGCCYVYKNCRVVGESPNRHMEFHPIELSVYEVEPQDVLKTNCPSLERIIVEYNHAYNKDNKCGKFGCCPDFDVGCDNTLHDEVITGNNEHLVKTYLENTIKKVPVRVPKDDEHGSNCWNHQFVTGEAHFVSLFNRNFPQPIDPPWWVWLILGCFAFCCLIDNIN